MIELTPKEKQRQDDAIADFFKDSPSFDKYMPGNRILWRYSDSPPLEISRFDSSDHIEPPVWNVGCLIFELQWSYEWKLVDAKCYRELQDDYA